MSENSPDSAKMNSPDEISWVRRVNARWIVRDGLRESATAYLDHLESTDPDRLSRSCSRARRVQDRSGINEDPKPWFYAGLFSLATEAEREKYLSACHFTLACLPAPSQAAPGTLEFERVGNATRETILRIRAAVAELAEEG